MKKTSFAGADYAVFSLLFFVFSLSLAGIFIPLKWISIDEVQGFALYGSVILFVFSVISLPFTSFAFYKVAKSWISIYLFKLKQK